MSEFDSEQSKQTNDSDSQINSALFLKNLSIAGIDTAGKEGLIDGFLQHLKEGNDGGDPDAIKVMLESFLMGAGGSGEGPGSLKERMAKSSIAEAPTPNSTPIKATKISVSKEQFLNR